MGKEYIVEKAVCTCKFGTTPGTLKITDNKSIYMNGHLTATTMTLGNVFTSPGFGICRISPSTPKPCTPMVTQWSDSYTGVSINGNSTPLTDTSKGSCAIGVPNCISIQTTGQISIPGIIQVKQSSTQHHADINPLVIQPEHAK